MFEPRSSVSYQQIEQRGARARLGRGASRLFKRRRDSGAAELRKQLGGKQRQLVALMLGELLLQVSSATASPIASAEASCASRNEKSSCSSIASSARA